MNQDYPLIYFYIPESDLPSDGIPENPHEYWYNFGGGITAGVYGWLVQTYQYLKNDGFPCSIVKTIPDEGIVLVHRKHLTDTIIPNSKLLIVCLKAERKIHPYAQVHIIGNEQDMDINTMLYGDRFLFPGYKYYVPHWPQPGLIPRDIKRGNKFENIAFFGEARNLSPQLQGNFWEQELKKMGLKWHLIGRESRDRWNDFSYVDAVVAIRNFHEKANYSWKPALKLYNAWHAGVPAILGCESAYQRERKNELDYIEVKSLDETFNALKKLLNDEQLRQKMMDNAKVRAQEISSQNIIRKWRYLFEQELVPFYKKWCTDYLYRQNFLYRRHLSYNTNGMRKKLRKFHQMFGIRSKIKSLTRK